MLTRRQILAGTGAGLALGAAQSARLVSARGILDASALDTIIGRALAAAKKAGASYADIRIHRVRNETVSTREDHITGINYDESYGLGVRALFRGAWGFAASSAVEAKEAVRVAHRAVQMARANARIPSDGVKLAPVESHVDVWQTALSTDPFEVSPEEKAEFLLSINRQVLGVKGISFVTSRVESAHEWKVFASTEGTRVEQNQTRMNPGYTATAIDSKKGEFASRDHEIQPYQGGWEYVVKSTMLADARLIGEQAVEKLKAPSVQPGPKDLVLLPSNLWLTLHESVGHPTELDRAMGYEANYAGTSFATVDKLGKLRYGSPLIDMYADKTTPGGLATCGYDDDGVKTQRWDIIKEGLFVGYQTTRDQAHWIGEERSRGCCYAQNYESFPFQRMPNLSLAPNPDPKIRTQDLVAATDDGVLVTGRGSWSIDHQRYNFQFGGQMFYEIKNGRVTRALNDVAYQSNSVEFWNACDMLGGEKTWRLGGSFHDGKGEPSQSNAVSHGCPSARFRGINVLNTKTKV